MGNKITIATPCHENWKSMQPNTKGKFCNACNKTVVDFTKMTPTEIQNYFAENTKKESICGYFKSYQIENESKTSYMHLSNRFNRIKIKPVKIVALFALGLLFTFSSCFMGKAAAELPEDLVESDTQQNEANKNLESTENVIDSTMLK